MAIYYSSRAIILKNFDYRESDRIVSVFTEKHGKVAAIARGVKKPKSSLRGCTQPFCHSWLYFNQGREMDLITQGKITDFFGNSREDFKRTLYMIYFMEILDKTLMERSPQPILFKKVLAILQLIDKEGYNPLFIRCFEMQVLVELGFCPLFNGCVGCGEPKELSNSFSIPQGGILCQQCQGKYEDEFILQGETKSILQMLEKGNLNILRRVKISLGAEKQLELFLEKYLEYHLERRFALKEVLRELKSSILLAD